LEDPETTDPPLDGALEVVAGGLELGLVAAGVVAAGVVAVGAGVVATGVVAVGTAGVVLVVVLALLSSEDPQPMTAGAMLTSAIARSVRGDLGVPCLIRDEPTPGSVAPSTGAAKPATADT
jgi:hypothetical protein